MPKASVRCALVGALLAPAVARGPATERVSVSSKGVEANSSSFGIWGLSDDGTRVLFDSQATNLVADDGNSVSDLFLRDRTTGKTIRVNVSSAGKETVTLTGQGVLAGSGDFVLFESVDGGLVSGDTNRQWDVFVRDVAAGTTVRVNVDASGAQDSAGATVGAISDDGNLVLFTSGSLTLVPTKTTWFQDVFLRDRANGTIEQLKTGAGGVEADGDSYAYRVTPDGRYVLLLTTATNLVAGDTNGQPDTYLFDRQTGTSVRVSLDESGNEPASPCIPVDVTPDGRFVTFSTTAPMVAGDSNGLYDVYLRDLVNGTIEPVSLDSSGSFGSSGVNDHSRGGGLSDDGRYVLFWSRRALTADDPNSVEDAFVRDRQLGTTSRASVASDGTGGNDVSAGYDAISADGATVAFVSFASDLIANDGNGAPDVFVHDFDRTPASWASYGAGFPGTLGIPSLTPNRDPELNQPVDLVITSSAPSAVGAVLFIGLAKAQLRTAWGGDLLVDPLFTLPLTLPPGGTTLSGTVPPDEQLCGLSAFLQLLQFDPGASERIAFSDGLELVFGR